MRVGALVLGILGGLIALSYGFLGYGLGNLTDIGQAETGSGMKTISLVVPVGDLVGAGMVMTKPLIGASLMPFAVVVLLLLLGFNFFSMIPVVLLGSGALLGFLGANESAVQQRKQTT